MDRQKSRKVPENRRYTSTDLDFSSNGRDSCNEKAKTKRRSSKNKYNTSLNNFPLNWSPQPRLHSIPQRPFSTSESSVCHYSVPLSLSFEPISLPIYSALIQPPGNCAVPLDMNSHFNKSKNRHKNRQCKANSVDHEPHSIFNTSRLNNGDQQDYTSLPPVNCDNFASKSSDTEAICKRRFSDPGIGQMSSDECSSSRSDDSDSTGTAEIPSNDFLALVEQINKLKENNSHLKRELNETKVELETLKMQSLIWRTGCDDFKPGALSDAISEIRNAVKLSEEALVLKVVQMLEKNSADCKEAQEKLEEKLRKEMNERISKLEQELNGSSPREIVSETRATETESLPEKDSDIQQQVVELEREKFQLRKELQEAVSKRKSAEATTEKLERLVGILRKKVNGVSLESCLPDEKHILVRPLASSLEKNPFIIANNRQGQKSDTYPIVKPRIPPFRAFPLETTEINVVLNDNKENEAESGSGNSNDSSSSSPSETPTVGVTITGPVTDL